MSVINQVLNQLEQRGEHTAPEQTMVRAVPRSRRSLFVPVLLGSLLVAALAVWQWAGPRKLESVAQSTVQAADSPEIAATVSSDASAIASSGEQPAEVPLPDLRLSFELSSVPIPSVQREESNGLVPGIEAAPAAKRAEVARQDVQRSAQIAPPKLQPSAQTFAGAAPIKQISPAQKADAEFRKAAALMQQGRTDDALAGYEAALRLDAGHDAARQAMVALLLEGKRGADAERVLEEGLKSRPQHAGFAMLLARLQVERGTAEQAMGTLEKTLPYADANADYQAFFAALLQRQNRHKEAINHYQLALQLAPNNGIWLMGYGISLQAVQRNEDAGNAYRRALESKMLSPELQSFVKQKLKAL